MFNGIKFWTDDNVWAQILSDLGAVLVEKTNADLIFTPPSKKISPIELKSDVLEELYKNETQTLERIAGNIKNELSGAQKKLLIDLSRGPVSPTKNSHSLDTNVYQLRKIFGKDFIISENGKYKLGNI